MAEDTGNFNDGSTAPKEEMLTMAPAFRSRSAGVTSRATRTAFMYRSSNPACQSASVRSSSSPFGACPVLFTTASTRPYRPRAASTRYQYSWSRPNTAANARNGTPKARRNRGP